MAHESYTFVAGHELIDGCHGAFATTFSTGRHMKFYFCFQQLLDKNCCRSSSHKILLRTHGTESADAYRRSLIPAFWRLRKRRWIKVRKQHGITVCYL